MSGSETTMISRLRLSPARIAVAANHSFSFDHRRWPETLRQQSVVHFLPCTRISVSARRETPSSDRIGFLEHPPVQREIVIALKQIFGVPVAALHTVEIAAIDMDSRGQAAERVRHRVDHVAPQRLGASLTQGFGAGGFDQSAGSTRNATPEDVVLPAR